MEKYMKVRKIGEGAFGKADLVKRKVDNSQLVIKEINIMRMGNKERMEARKEVSVLAQLNHPNIVAYRESFEENGNLYIVMDYCAGGDLYAKINTQKGVLFTEDMILDWFVQMCLAIKHIHDRKILHRDIKSQNIFLTSKGLVQLGDFGIAKVLNSTVELARTCIGTPYYLSPEICENKPYNNKSDIWSLGCVLYELATLKHAFEAGNMKNLVLKIIRGSYPPVAPKYSYEMRNLIAQLFKRAPRDRPSINSVLRKPLLSQRIPKFLTQEQLSSEFSHTIMHGQKLGRALPPPPKEAARPPSAARNRPDVGGAAAAAAAVKRYDPSKVYGAPVIKKPREVRASAEKKRPGSAGSRPGSAAGSRPGSAAGSRPGSAAGNRPANSQAGMKKTIVIKNKHIHGRPPFDPRQDLKKKRQDLLEKEKKRREEIQKKEYERRHKELQEKQKLARINRSREDGWNHLLSSIDSDKGRPEKSPRDAQYQRQQPAVPPRPVAAGDYNGNNANGQKDRGKYDHYNQYLDKLQKDRDVRQRQDGVPAPAPAAAYMAAPRPLPGAPKPAPVWRQAPKVPAPTPIYQAHNQRGQNQQEQRAKLVNDFINRKREAELNKQRGQAQLFGPSSNNQQRPPSGANNRVPDPQQHRPPSAVSARDREEQEYLEKLRQIRQQNYQDRRNVLGKKSPEQEAAERMKKAEALKKQAEDWAKQRQGVIEQKKQDLYDKEKQLREVRQNINKPGVPVVKPKPSVPMTGAVNAIGVTPRVIPDISSQASRAPAMTGALGAIGAVPKMVEPDDDSRPKSQLQKKKESILKKLNEKGPPKESEDAPESARSKWGGGAKLSLAEQTQEAEPESARAQWGGGAKLSLAEQTLEAEPESARPQWGRAPDLNLGKITLEETGSQMEVTSARDRVIINPESVRRQWGGPGETVVNALQGAPLAETISSTNSDESVPSPASTGDAPKPAGSTITISRAPIKSGTVTISTAVDKAKDGDKDREVPNIIPAANQKTETVSPDKNRTDVETNPSNQNAEKQASSNQIEDAINSDQPQQASVDQKAENVPNLMKKPPVPTKPVIAEKPLLLPKPVLLAKPDSPMKFETGTPTPGRDLGAGSLFEKVELEEEEEPAVEKKVTNQESGEPVIKDIKEKPSNVGDKKKKGGLVLGITMGSFDIGHSELLRTCSEPDLSSLFRTMAATTSNVRVRSLDDMSTVNEEDDIDDDENDIEAVYNSMEKAVSQRLEEGDDKDDNLEENNQEEMADEGEDDEDIADLISVRATMQSLLLDDSDEEEIKKSPVKFNLSSDRESRGDTNDGDIDDTEDDVEMEVNDDDDDDMNDSPNVDDGSDKNDDADGEDDDEADDVADDVADDDDVDDADGDNIDKDDNDSGIPRSHSVDNENPQTPEDESTDIVSELFQTDDSDSEFNDGDEMGDFDLFGRLEESRANLEQELGAEKLVKVYKTVQALQEDEDENMEDGARLAQELLGKEKEHLYPQIFQLVMADAAFTDDGAYDFDDLDESYR